MLALVTAVAGAMAVACSSAGAQGGTIEALPGPVPEDAEFREAPDDAPSAPEFELELLDGEMVKMSELWEERPVVLVFFEAWCEPCGELQPGLNDVVDDYRDVVTFIGVAGYSEPDELREYVDEHDVGYPVGTDPDGSRWLKYGVSEPPLLALVSQGGALLRGWPGGITESDLRAYIDEYAVAHPHP
ncbi:hypothetical protein EF847_20480 [Actinobacteria bacterium YIM 96077]|uniref:Thioredoxin domain-containing protein n=1 Tax=Phytoactinopolyspora halophila TaxID=1981511 RepID=A0A329QH95_9ACTN|nr:hypothetical protein EF847_20480 [Actinobacteria bacterium YIM 96077]RAW11576.1 hypothetical protein DPM12_15970 [Phytoactinopolyspora halophila]